MVHYLVKTILSSMFHQTEEQSIIQSQLLDYLQLYLLIALILPYKCLFLLFNINRFWVKYGCDSKGANCLIGDSVANFNLYPQTGCPASGTPLCLFINNNIILFTHTCEGCMAPVDSLFEATWGCKTGSSCAPTYFDTSQVDGYTLPYRVLITGILLF